MSATDALHRFFELLRSAVNDGTLVKLTLGKPTGADPTLRNVFVRPVALKSGPHFAFVWRHATRDITKNHPPLIALTEVERLVGHEFLDAHLFTKTQTAQLETTAEGAARLRVTAQQLAPVRVAAHDRPKTHTISATSSWLRALGVANERGQPREGMADKFRQIQKFAELLDHLLADAFPADNRSSAAPLRVMDMGSGKGYLTFAVAELMGAQGVVCGVELRGELVELCNRIARENGMAERLSFRTGSIAETPLPPGSCDVMIALHACDTATDDALARGVAAGARLLVVAPCCQKELRPQLTPPPVLADALRHGIFQERQAEFVTDALRAQLLEGAGYRTKVFEFISTEHTAKNLMIAAMKQTGEHVSAGTTVERAREFAAFYGIRTQRLAAHLGVSLSPGT